MLDGGFSGAGFAKPKPNFDWADLDELCNPTIPEDAINLQDVMDHYGVKERRAHAILAECKHKGVLKNVPGRRGWYQKP